MSSRRDVVSSLAREREGVSDGHTNFNISKEFASLVFTEKDLRQRVSKDTYKSYVSHREKLEKVPMSVIEQIAIAIKEWANEKGCTHYTHQFQPLSGVLAEKHDSFVEFSKDGVIADFNASLLSMGEPDASSFANGGIRSTYQARGYTVWDISSPVYLKPAANGLTLVIPTAFFSWSGESLDHKAPLLRSCDRLSTSATRLLNLVGYSDVKSAFPTLGAEQEYFLIDRGFYLQRPDLVSCGRTLFGALPPKNQQLEDHYFGSLNARTISYMQDTEHQLWRMGVPVKTRHCEVAPGQFETAPIFEAATIASDHNLLELEVMKTTARKHGLEFIDHEKPFAGVNGSGKHNNYSIATHTGLNLFEPSSNPMTNTAFLVSLASLVRAVDMNGDVLRLAIAIPGNDFRLGANEAPPAIVSVYLGDFLEGIVQRIINGDLENNDGKNAPIEVVFETGTNLCPEVHRSITDRNRTSTFPFVGNKFEFRAVGSSQNCAVPVTALNTIVAESMDYVHDQIKAQIASGKNVELAVAVVVRETLTKHRRIIFNGNGYSPEWAEEAAKRGIPNLRTAVDALPLWTSEKNVKLFEGVMNQRELEVRREVGLETFVKVADIEGKTGLDMWKSSYLPACLQHQAAVADSLAKLKAVMPASSSIVAVQEANLRKFLAILEDAFQAAETLEAAIEASHGLHGDTLAEAKHARDHVRVALAGLRVHVDKLELIVEDNLWPFPKYREMLSSF